jgi:hypothetical protein
MQLKKASCSGFNLVSVTLPTFHESFLLTPGFSYENEEMKYPAAELRGIQFLKKTFLPLDACLPQAGGRIKVGVV